MPRGQLLVYNRLRTRPIDYFDEVHITGLISEPIVLHSRYAQSASPMHHNFGAEHICSIGGPPNPLACVGTMW